MLEDVGGEVFAPRNTSLEAKVIGFELVSWDDHYLAARTDLVFEF